MKVTVFGSAHDLEQFKKAIACFPQCRHEFTFVEHEHQHLECHYGNQRACRAESTKEGLLRLLSVLGIADRCTPCQLESSMAAWSSP
jgi:hypothetical protein